MVSQSASAMRDQVTNYPLVFWLRAASPVRSGIGRRHCRGIEQTVACYLGTMALKGDLQRGRAGFGRSRVQNDPLNQYGLFITIHQPTRRICAKPASTG